MPTRFTVRRLLPHCHRSWLLQFDSQLFLPGYRTFTQQFNLPVVPVTVCYRRYALLQCSYAKSGRCRTVALVDAVPRQVAVTHGTHTRLRTRALHTFTTPAQLRTVGAGSPACLCYHTVPCPVPGLVAVHTVATYTGLVYPHTVNGSTRIAGFTHGYYLDSALPLVTAHWLLQLVAVTGLLRLVLRAFGSARFIPFARFAFTQVHHIPHWLRWFTPRITEVTRTLVTHPQFTRGCARFTSRWTRFTRFTRTYTAGWVGYVHGYGYWHVLRYQFTPFWVWFIHTRLVTFALAVGC